MEQFIELFKNHKNLQEVNEDTIILRIPHGYFAFDVKFLFWEKEGNLFRFEVNITRYEKLNYQSDSSVFNINGIDYVHSNRFLDFNSIILGKFLMSEGNIKDFLNSNMGKWICDFVDYLNRKISREISSTTLGCSF